MNRRREQQQNRGAAAADVSGDAIRSALQAAGIGEPILTDLAKHPAITLDLIRRESSNGQLRGKGPGAVVLNIKAALEAEQVRTIGRNRAAVHMAIRKATDAADGAIARLTEEQRIAFIEHVDEGELGRLVGDAIIKAKPIFTNRWRRLVKDVGPRQALIQNRSLRAAIRWPAAGGVA